MWRWPNSTRRRTSVKAVLGVKRRRQVIMCRYLKGRLVLFSVWATPQPGPPGLAGARRKLLDFMVQGKINRGRHTDHPAGRHSIRTNQYPPPLSLHFLQAGCPSCRQTNSVKALKAKGGWATSIGNAGIRPVWRHKFT